MKEIAFTVKFLPCHEFEVHLESISFRNCFITYSRTHCTCKHGCLYVIHVLQAAIGYSCRYPLLVSILVHTHFLQLPIPEIVLQSLYCVFYTPDKVQYPQILCNGGTQFLRKEFYTAEKVQLCNGRTWLVREESPVEIALQDWHSRNLLISSWNLIRFCYIGGLGANLPSQTYMYITLLPHPTLILTKHFQRAMFSARNHMTV